MPIKTVYQVRVAVPSGVWEHPEYKDRENKIVAPWITWETDSVEMADIATFASMSDAKGFENQMNSLVEKIKKDILSKPVERD